MELNSGDIQIQKIDQIESITDHMQDISSGGSDIFTKKYGNQNMVQFLKGIISIIKMRIHLIISFQTLNADRGQNTYQVIQKNGLVTIRNRLKTILIQFDHLLKNGIHQKKESNGIQNTEDVHGLPECPSIKYVYTVGKNIQTSVDEIETNSALMFVNQHGEDYKGLIMKQEPVVSVDHYSKPINMCAPEPALENVRVLSKVKLKQKEKVYNLTVEHAHEYFANGVLVSNCDALRYVIIELSKPAMKPVQFPQFIKPMGMGGISI